MSEGSETTEGNSAAPAKRARYLHPLADYEKIYGRKERALKGWIAIGRDVKPNAELPPLDQPALMKHWWTRHMSQRVPDEIANLAITPAAAPPPAASTPPLADTPPGPLFAARADAVPPSPQPSPPQSGIGYLGALHRLREAEAKAGRLYVLLLTEAAEPSSSVEDRSRLSAEAEQARRSWDDLVNRLRPMEKDATEILTAAGLMWGSDEVVASMTAIHISLKESVLSLWRRARARLRACVDPAEEEKLWREEVDKIFAALRANKFTRCADVDSPADHAAA